MNRLMQYLAITVALSPLSAQTAAPTSATFDLFTAGEAAAWNSQTPGAAAPHGTRELPHPGVPSCHDIPAAAALTASDPQIKILAPAFGKPLAAPVDIDVQFVPAGSAAIRPDSFRVCYVGFVTIDITKRITDRVAVSAQGLHVAGAQLPSGHHHLVMLIADQQGQVGSREAVFDIQ